MVHKNVRERLRFEVVNITTAGADSTPVPPGKTRNVVSIFLIGDGANSVTVTVAKVEPDGTTVTPVFPDVPLSPAEFKAIPPQGYHLENPVLILNVGSRLRFTSSAGNPKATIAFWDE